MEFARPWSDSFGTPWEVTENAWPRSMMPVLYRGHERILSAMRWGVRPFYDRKPKPTFVTDARDDALFTKSIWKSAAKNGGRCLAPASGFFEWAGVAGMKWEVYFHLQDERPFFFAGLWSRDPEGDGAGFAIITTRPNELLAAVPHERMPVILNDAGAKQWIGNDQLSESQVLELCRPYPADDMVRFDMPRRSRTKAPGGVADLFPE